jgi:hypothetical protein
MILKIYSILTLVLSIQSIHAMDFKESWMVGKINKINKISNKKKKNGRKMEKAKKVKEGTFITASWPWKFDPKKYLKDISKREEEQNKQKKGKEIVKSTQWQQYPPVKLDLTNLPPYPQEFNVVYDTRTRNQNILDAINAINWNTWRCKVCKTNFRNKGGRNKPMPTIDVIEERILRHVDSKPHKDKFGIEKNIYLDTLGVQIYHGERCKEEGINWITRECLPCNEQYTTSLSLLKHLHTNKHEANKENLAQEKLKVSTIVNSAVEEVDFKNGVDTDKNGVTFINPIRPFNKNKIEKTAKVTSGKELRPFPFDPSDFFKKSEKK